jgi:hypothetical protein
MNRFLKIAVINPGKRDGLASTILDGLLSLSKSRGNLQFFLSEKYNYVLPLDDRVLPRKDFISFAREADLILLIAGKKFTDYKLAKQIKKWDKTVFIDGSEVGKNRRYDFKIQKKILDGKYKGYGAINKKMLKKCKLYFRREKPYIDGILPLPFGIESNYIKYYKSEIKKDIDFFAFLVRKSI